MFIVPHSLFIVRNRLFFMCCILFCHICMFASPAHAESGGLGALPRTTEATLEATKNTTNTTLTQGSLQGTPPEVAVAASDFDPIPEIVPTQKNSPIQSTQPVQPTQPAPQNTDSALQQTPASNFSLGNPPSQMQHPVASLLTPLSNNKSFLYTSEAQQEYLHSLANTGSTRAMYLLGLYYSDRAYYTEAEIWIEKAADQKEMLAIMFQAIHQAQGIGIPKNEELAQKTIQDNWQLLTTQAIQQDPQAIYLVAYIYYLEISPEKIEKTDASGLAKHWLEQNLVYEDPLSFTLMAQLEQGIGNPEILAKTTELLEKAGELYSADALFQLGLYYERGSLESPDETTYLRYYTQASDLNHLGATYRMAQYYEDIDQSPKGQALAKLWYEKAAKLGHEQAQVRLNNWSITPE